MDPARPFASICMPVRNERDFIARSLGSVLAQDYPADLFEILVVDGMSDDGTRELIEKIIDERQDLAIKVLDNPQRIVATALNIGLGQARGEIILRVDGHCEIDRGHLSRCVDELTGSVEAPAGVGGPVETVSGSYVGRGIAAAMGSRFGVGGSAFRVGVATRGVSDTVPFPAYPRSTIELAGPYDEELVRNQDDEYNYRIRGLGGQLLLDPALRSRYHSRSSLGKLWRQYFQYGFWKVRVLQKHPRQMSLRQFVPVALVLALLGAAGLGLAAWEVLPVLAILPMVYLVGVLLAAVAVAVRQGLSLLPVVMAAFLALHLGYGSGFLMGMVRFWNRWGDRSTLVGGTRLEPGRSPEEPE